MTTLTITYGGSNTNVAVNVSAVMGGDAVVGKDYQSLVNTILTRG